MAYNHNISVKVCGNPESSGGFGPILLLNNPSFVVEDQFYVGFDKNSFFFTITTYQTQTVYKLVKNNVRSSGAFRVGSLVIAISIPKNYKLEGGYTPYDVLCALKDEFLKKCMTCKDPVRETYEYNAGKIDGHVLDEVVSKFTLTDSRAPYRVMTPNGPVGYIEETEEKIKEFFQDVNYPEFVKFKEVVVATTVHTTSYVPISNIQIPRPKKYEVIVDGERMGFYSNLNEKIPVECHWKSPDYYDNLSWEFSIQDLIDRNTRHEGVDLDTGQERVIVNTKLWGTPKEKKVFLVIFPKESKDYFIKNPQKLLVTLDSFNTLIKVEVSPQRLLVITLKGNEIEALKYGGINVATTERSIYKVKKCQLVEEDELHVEVEPRELPSPPPADELKVKVIFPEDKDLGGISYVDLQAKNCINNQDVFSVSNLLLKRSSEKEGYNGMFKIRAKNVPPCDFYLKCSIKNEVWKTGEIKPNQKSVTVTFVKIHRPFTDRYRKPLVCVLATLMALVLGGLSFVLYNKLNEETIPTTEQEIITKKDVEPFLSKVNSLLKTKDLEFSTVDSLYKEYCTYKDTIDAYGGSMTNFHEICQRLDDYNKVKGFIQQGDVNSIDEVVNDPNSYKLNDIHMKVLQEIVANQDNKNLFEGKFETFRSFAAISEMYERHSGNNNQNYMDSLENVDGNKGNSENEYQENTEEREANSSKEGTKHRYTCEKCGPDRWFRTNGELQNHIRANHKNSAAKTTKFVCEVCGKDFKSKNKLAKHTANDHEE